MINLSFKTVNGKIVGFSCVGHSGYAESGADIVCAAISSLAQNVEVCLSEVLNIKYSLKRNDKLGQYQIELARNIRDEEISSAQPIFKSFMLSSKKIEKEYKKYLKVEVKDEIV